MRKFINSKKVKGNAPCSAMVQADNLVYITAQIPIDYVSGNIIVDNTENATRQVMENIKMLLKELNYNLSDIIKTTIYYTEPSEESEILGVYKNFFTGVYPSYCLVGAAFLPKGVGVQIDAIASK